MSNQDRYAHLRQNLSTYRSLTAVAEIVPWCIGCESHLAAFVGGLCPVCESDAALRETAA